MYYMGFSYKEVYDLPIEYKRWFIERVSKELKKGSEEGKSTQSKALEANTPDMRALQGYQRTEVPARLRRFT